VLLDGEPVRSCLLFAVQAEGARIETIESLPSEPTELHPVQQAFWEKHGLQCGFCTPGMVMAAVSLIDECPNPTEAEIRQMRAGLKSANEQRLRLERWQKGDVAGMPAELSQLSEAERRAVLEDLLAETLRSTDAAHRLVDGKDDASAVSAWNRTELEEWEKSHAVSETGSYDIFGEAESISIAARGETADCWLERKDPLSAQRVVSPCVGGGRNWHSGCVNPLRKAGTLLAQTGHVPEAMAIYRRLESAGLAVGELAAAIEKAAPGSLAPPQPRSR
jgi:hypothetical protein